MEGVLELRFRYTTRVTRNQTKDTVCLLQDLKTGFQCAILGMVTSLGACHVEILEELRFSEEKIFCLQGRALIGIINLN